MIKYARCGAYGHAWFEYDTTWKPEFGNPMTLRCERCGTERRDQFSNRGVLIARHYEHPDDYHYVKGQRPSRDEFRMAVYREKNPEKHNKVRVAKAQDALAERRRRKASA